MSETIESAKELARIYMREGIPCFIEGPPGVGKSQAWRQLAEEAKIGFIDLRLAQMDPVDLRGLPKHHKDYTTWSLPDFWPIPERDGERGIILFDEMSDTTRAMQSAAYQVILDGFAGPHKIHPGWYRAAAGNRRVDRAGAQPMSTALARRFAWITVEADVDCLREYLASKDTHHYVTSFLKFRPALVHSMEGADLRAFPNPASWERVGQVCDEPVTRLFRLVRGLVGEGAAGEFCSYIRGINIPELEEVVASPSRCRIPSEPASKWALACMLARYATRQNFDKIITYCKRAEFGRDFEIVAVLDATKRDGSLTETVAYVDFANRNAAHQL